MPTAFDYPPVQTTCQVGMFCREKAGAGDGYLQGDGMGGSGRTEPEVFRYENLRPANAAPVLSQQHPALVLYPVTALGTSHSTPPGLRS